MSNLYESEYADPSYNFERVAQLNKFKRELKKKRSKLIWFFSAVYLMTVIIPALYLEFFEDKTPSMFVWRIVIGLYLVALTSFDLWSRYRIKRLKTTSVSTHPTA